MDIFSSDNSNVFFDNFALVHIGKFFFESKGYFKEDVNTNNLLFSTFPNELFLPIVAFELFKLSGLNSMLSTQLPASVSLLIESYLSLEKRFLAFKESSKFILFILNHEYQI